MMYGDLRNTRLKTYATIQAGEFEAKFLVIAYLTSLKPKFSYAYTNEFFPVI